MEQNNNWTTNNVVYKNTIVKIELNGHYPLVVATMRLWICFLKKKDFY